jgi:hypothetical protein
MSHSKIFRRQSADLLAIAKALVDHAVAKACRLSERGDIPQKGYHARKRVECLKGDPKQELQRNL